MKKQFKKITQWLNARFAKFEKWVVKPPKSKLATWFINNDWFLPVLNLVIGAANAARAYFMEGSPIWHWSLAGFSFGVGIGLLLVIPIRKQVKKRLTWMKVTSTEMIEQMEEARAHMKMVKENMDIYKNATDFEEDKKNN